MEIEPSGDSIDALEVVEDDWEALEVEKTPLEDENRSTRSRETSFEEKFYNFLEKVRRKFEISLFNQGPQKTPKTPQTFWRSLKTVGRP